MSAQDRDDLDRETRAEENAQEAENGIHRDRDNNNAIGDEVGEAAGGISGVVTGAALGSLGGPLGTIIGGIAGAIGGWWAGREVSHAARHFTEDDNAFYREHYESSSDRLADRSYDDVRPAYQLGHLAGHNPAYQGQTFEVVETDLRRGWDTSANTAHGEWDRVRGYARDAFHRASNSPSAQHMREDANQAAENDDKGIDGTAGVRYY